MRRYIDASAILNEKGNSFKFGDETYYHESIIQNAPTVDVVPVSYICKRAMELKNDDMIYAYTVLNSLIANYRADGERKEDGN